MSHPTQRGMTSIAWAALEEAFDRAKVKANSSNNWRVTQAQGNAPASKGYHASDGHYEGKSYTAAVDVSTRGLGNSLIATVLEEMCQQGFVAFFRNWEGNRHIHGNFCGTPMKRQLDSQNYEFFRGEDGLVGNGRIDQEWWYPDTGSRWIPEKMFSISNPKSGKGRIVTRADVVKPKDEITSYGLYFQGESKPRLWMPVFSGTSYAPTRAFGSMLGLDVVYDAKTNTVKFDNEDRPIAVKIVATIGHSPIRSLLRETGLKLVSVNPKERAVIFSR
jgi:hypothetical protein